MKVSMAKRHEYWNHFIARWVTSRTMGRLVTAAKLRKVEAQMMNDDTFWWDIVLRHGGDRVTPEEMERADPAVYDHCVGNFWGGIVQDLVKAGLIK